MAFPKTALSFWVFLIFHIAGSCGIIEGEVKGESGMRDDYQNAKKIGDKYKASALLKGKEPYLPSLETEIEDISTYKEIHVGIAEIPLDMIVGTRTTARSPSKSTNQLIAHHSLFGRLRSWVKRSTT